MNTAIDGADITLDLTEITGLQEGDIVFISSAVAADRDRAMSVKTGTGWTAIAELYANDSYDANLEGYWKIMGATPDTSVTLTGGGLSYISGVAIARAFRGVDTASPIYDTATATGTNTGYSEPGGVDTVTGGAVVVMLGIGARVNWSNSIVPPANYETGFLFANADDNVDTWGALGYNLSPSNPENPDTFPLNLSAETTDSWTAITVSLSPAASGPSTETIEKGLAYAVKSTPKKTKALAYKIKSTPTKKTKALAYAVKSTASAITKGMEYAVTSHTAVQKDLGYAVRSTPTKQTKTLAYSVQTVNSVTKGLAYTVRTNTTLQATLEYAISSEATRLLQKDLDYAIRHTVGKARVIDSYAGTNQNADGGNSPTLLQWGQALTLPACTISEISFWIRNTSQAVDADMTARIYNATGTVGSNAVPTGAAIAESIAVSALDVPYNYTKVTFKFAEPVDITAGDYAIGLNFSQWAGCSTALDSSGEHAGNTYRQNSPWSAIGTYDTCFEIGTTGGEAIPSKTLEYSILSTPTITKGLAYTVKTGHQIEKALAYSIYNSRAITKALEFKVKSAQATQKGMEYTVSSTPSPLEKTLAYTVKTQQLLQIGLAYEVTDLTDTYSVQLGMEYAVKKSQSITKGMKYSIKKEPGKIRKTMEYAILVYPYCPKAEVFTEAETPFTKQAEVFRALPRTTCPVL